MKVISKDGVSIAYSKTGNGPALILVDGAFCYRDYGVTPSLAPFLSDYFTVYAYDRRGRGESGDEASYTVNKEIEDLNSIVEVTNEAPYICGISSGAGLVLQAINKGVTAKKIALFEPPYVVTTTDGFTPPIDAEKELKRLVNQGKRSEAVQYFMTKVMEMPTLFVFLFKLFGKSLWQKNETVAHTLAYDVAIMGNYSNPLAITRNIKIPTIVIGGEKSPAKLKNAVTEIAKSIPDSRLSLLKGQSHNVNTKVFAPVLIDFFNQ
jgi:pimeloyl-ACP methyl ester carboxylesterase